MAAESRQWSVAEAKARLSEVIERAVQDGPQTITRRGRKTVVVVSAEEWMEKTRKSESLVDFLDRSPLRGSGLVIERERDGFREIEL